MDDNVFISVSLAGASLGVFVVVVLFCFVLFCCCCFSAAQVFLFNIHPILIFSFLCLWLGPHCGP